jgi:hypothetical protein
VNTHFSIEETENIIGLLKDMVGLKVEERLLGTRRG